MRKSGIGERSSARISGFDLDAGVACSVFRDDGWSLIFIKTTLISRGFEAFKAWAVRSV